jgi:hypothetical protein
MFAVKTSHSQTTSFTPEAIKGQNVYGMAMSV